MVLLLYIGEMVDDSRQSVEVDGLFKLFAGKFRNDNKSSTSCRQLEAWSKK